MQLDARRAQQIRVGGPRRTSHGSIDRLRATVRMRLIRMRAKAGAAPLGRNDDEPEDHQSNHNGCRFLRCGGRQLPGHIR